MLARRAKGQKPRPALSFQNAERGFLETKIENYMRGTGLPLLEILKR
jgi:hypothetical protein